VGLPPRRHFLHAAWLIFRHPVSGQVIDVRSPLPAELLKAIVTISGPDLSFVDADPLEYLGFYRPDT
jgi:23S rRNA pseudouridine1911/1915/1917 synthase